MSKLLERVLLHEGFREKPYRDSLGYLTFGHGLTYITRRESEAIVTRRLLDIEERLLDTRPWLGECPPEVLCVLSEMVFQLGFQGVSKFKKMLSALHKRQYWTASREMLDSRWAEQTPDRAKELSEIIRALHFDNVGNNLD